MRLILRIWLDLFTWGRATKARIRNCDHGNNVVRPRHDLPQTTSRALVSPATSSQCGFASTFGESQSLFLVPFLSLSTPPLIPPPPIIMSIRPRGMTFFTRKKTVSSLRPLSVSTFVPSPFFFFFHLVQESSQSQSQPPPQQQQQPRHVYPWTARRLDLLPPTSLSKSAPPSGPSPSPFPRYGHALSASASGAGELFLFGGLVHDSARNDLYVFSTQGLAATLLQTSGKIPSPRVGHAVALVGSVLLIWGGDTNTEVPNEPQDDSLYLLNLSTSDL